jgi:signal transduction histidine kinase
MAMAFQRWFTILAAALFTLVFLPADTVVGQSAIHWSFFKTSDGLPEPVFHFISITPQGKLVAADVAGSWVSELDGYAISNLPAPHNFTGHVGESPGGQRWAMTAAGLLEFKDGVWLVHAVPEIAAAARAGFLQSPLPFIPVRQGCVVFLLPDRLLEFSAEDPDHPRTILIRTAAQTRIGPFTGMAVAPDGCLWLCGAGGVAKAAGPVRNLSPEIAWEEHLPPASLRLEHLRAPSPDRVGGLTVVAESAAGHQTIAATFDGRAWIVRPAGARKLLRAWGGPDRTFWAATPESLFEWEDARTNWVENDEIPAGQIYDVELEPGGAFWLATADGLIRAAASLWQTPEAVPDLNAPVPCLAMNPTGVAFIAENQLYVVKAGRPRIFSLPFDRQNPVTVGALFPLKDGSFLLDTGGVPLQFQPNDHAGDQPAGAPGGAFKTLDETPGRPLGILPDGNVCLYYRGQKNTWVDFDGKQRQPLANPPPINLLDDPNLATLFTAPNGDLWVGGAQEILWRHGDRWQRFVFEENVVPAGAIGFAERPGEKIWCATRDELWEFDGKNWRRRPGRFNHINALLTGRDGGVWLASNGGLFRFCRGAWLENSSEEGLPNGAVYALEEDAGGQLWAATARGVRIFHPETEAETPKTFVHQLSDDPGRFKDRITEGAALNLLLAGRDKWKMTAPEHLLYSYQLDQLGWSAFRDQTVLSFPNLTAGRHDFQVQALNSAGNVETVPMALDFTVVAPWFKEIRLWVVLALGLVLALFFASVAWDRHRQLVRSHAAVERKVAERTQELERATRELIHSQKMNALGTLAAGIAHDFNNILSIIKGSAQIIEDNPGNREKIHIRVNRIKTVVQQGAEIVDAMLGFSRGPDTPAAPSDINATVADTVKLLGDRFLREVEVTFERGENLPDVMAPREFIQQILLNFIFNAVEAMNGSRTIVLTTRWVNVLPPDIVLAPTAPAPFVLISVRDAGGGIAPEILGRIFEPFFTTKALSTRRGTGLGLSMVYELAKKMQAGLAVQSVVGQGSTFTLILPAPVRPATPPAREASIPSPVS